MSTVPDETSAPTSPGLDDELLHGEGEGSLDLPLSPMGGDRVRWGAIVATLVTAVGLAVAGQVGFAALVGVALATSLVLAWAWPVLGGSYTPQATSLVLAVAALAIVPTAYREDLRWTAAAVAFGIVLAFFAQLVRGPGRKGLVLTLLASFAGLVPIASITAATVVADSTQGAALLTVCTSAVVGALVADLLVVARPVAPLLGLVALVASVGTALLAVVVAGSADDGVTTAAAVGIGAAAGTVSWSFRRVLVLQPAMMTLRGQVAAGVGSVLLTGVLVRLFDLVS